MTNRPLFTRCHRIFRCTAHATNTRESQLVQKVFLSIFVNMRVQVVLLPIIWVIIFALCVQEAVSFGRCRKWRNSTGRCPPNSCTLDSDCSHKEICCYKSCQRSECSLSGLPDGTTFGLILGAFILVCLLVATGWFIRFLKKRAPYDRLAHQNSSNILAAGGNLFETEPSPPHQGGVPPSYHDKEETPNPPPLYEERHKALPPPSYSTGTTTADEPPPPYKKSNYGSSEGV